MGMKRDLRESIRNLVGDHERMLLGRLSFTLGLRPRVNLQAADSFQYPEGRRAAVVVSADLELAWAWRWARGITDPAAYAHQRAIQGRRNLGPVLDLCDRYELPVTWATVGHLFLDSCTRTDGRIHSDIPRVPYFANDLWSYHAGDWFDHDPGLQDPSEPEWSIWHGPDLIRNILARPTRHEIGCHTFSHTVFSDRICPPEVAEAELKQCRKIAAAWNLELRS